MDGARCPANKKGETFLGKKKKEKKREKLLVLI